MAPSLSRAPRIIGLAMGEEELDDYRFCPRCGRGLEPRVVKTGERARPACSACAFVAYRDPKLAACTVFMHDGGIVLMKRGSPPQKGRWVFPGGFVDRGEPVHVAAVRETREEVGLRVSLTGILDVYSFPGEATAVVVYAAHVLSGRLEAREEAEEVRAFPPETLPWDALGFDSTRAALRDYLRRFFPRVRPPRAS
jgi:ADP-ribose pyrophosphatase YjhB (NUDIX family)